MTRSNRTLAFCSWVWLSHVFCSTVESISVDVFSIEILSGIGVAPKAEAKQGDWPGGTVGGFVNNSAKLAKAAGVWSPVGPLSFIFQIRALNAEVVGVCGTGAFGERFAWLDDRLEARPPGPLWAQANIVEAIGLGSEPPRCICTPSCTLSTNGCITGYLVGLMGGITGLVDSPSARPWCGGGGLTVAAFPWLEDGASLGPVTDGPYAGSHSTGRELPLEQPSPQRCHNLKWIVITISSLFWISLPRFWLVNIVRNLLKTSSTYLFQNFRSVDFITDKLTGPPTTLVTWEFVSTNDVVKGET